MCTLLLLLCTMLLNLHRDSVIVHKVAISVQQANVIVHKVSVDLLQTILICQGFSKCAQ